MHDMETRSHRPQGHVDRILALYAGIVLSAIFFVLLPAHALLGNSYLRVTETAYTYWAVLAVAAALIIGLIIILLMRFRVPALALLAAFLVAVSLQHLLLTDLTVSGLINGRNPSFGSLSWISYVTTAVYLAVFITIFVLLRSRPNPTKAIYFILTACVIAIASSVGLKFSEVPTTDLVRTTRDIGSFEKMFELSDKLNVIHLMPDSLQTDVVFEAFEAAPNLKEKFKGFRLFQNHLGTFPSTAPTLPTIFTGEIYDLANGFEIRDVGRIFDEKAFTNTIANNGARVHFFALHKNYCGRSYTTCIVGTFGDLIPKGLFDSEKTDSVNAAIMFDLTLVKSMPAVLVPIIYNGGNLFLSLFARRSVGLGSVPDPVIQDWVKEFHVKEGTPPSYFWYHYIGTHPPAQWDSNCRLHDRAELTRDSMVQQTVCVLTGIARLIDRLEALNIYDKTAIVINADTGIGIPSTGLSADDENFLVTAATVGMARPLLMMKVPGDSSPLRKVDYPSSQIDVAPTILALFAGATAEAVRFPGTNLLQTTNAAQPRKRSFNFFREHDYTYGKRTPVPLIAFDVSTDPTDKSGWKVGEVKRYHQAPNALREFSAGDASEFSVGSLNNTVPVTDDGVWIAGRQLVIMLGASESMHPNALTLRVHIPDFNPDTTFDLSVNGELVARQTKMKTRPDIWWSEQTLCVPGVAINAGGNNLVALEFSSAVKPEGSAYKLSAVVRDMEFGFSKGCPTP